MESKQSSATKILHSEGCAVVNPSRTLKLWNAALTGCLECVNTALTSGADVNMTEKYSGRTPLMEAVKNDYSECIDGLLEMGADVNKVDCTQKTAIFYATEGRKYNTNIIIKLFEAGADVNHKDATGRTVLMHAVDNESEKYNVVNALLKKIASVNNEGAGVNNKMK